MSACLHFLMPASFLNDKFRDVPNKQQIKSIRCFKSRHAFGTSFWMLMHSGIRFQYNSVLSTLKICSARYPSIIINSSRLSTNLRAPSSSALDASLVNRTI